MGVDTRVDELHVDAHFVAGLLDGAFEHMRHTELLRYCLEVFRLAFVFCRRGARDHFQVRNARQLCEDLVLNTIREVSVRLVFA